MSFSVTHMFSSNTFYLSSSTVKLLFLLDQYRPVKHKSEVCDLKMSNLDQICLWFNFDLFLFPLVQLLLGSLLLCAMDLNVLLLKAVTCRAGNTSVTLCFPSILPDLGPNTDE